MKAFGISALVIAIVAIFVPILGPFLTGLAGMLAFFSAGKGTSLGLAATIINIVNICFLSPSLIIAASQHSATANNSKVTTAFGVLLLIQIVAILIFICKWALSKRNVATAANKSGR